MRMQCRMLTQRAVEIADPTGDSAVHGLLEQVPVETGLVVPLVPLPELTAHEEQLLPRMRPHVSQQQAQISELPPLVSRHLSQQRSLAINNFIVRERKHEVLVERVPEAERERIVLVLSMHRILH